MGLVYHRHLNSALRVAEANEFYHKWRLGAIIMKGGSMRSVGVSELHAPARIASIEHLKDISTHAEIDALSRCGSPKGSTVFVARVGRNGKAAMAKPCDDCTEALREHGVKRVVYTVNPTAFDTLRLG